MHLNTTGFILTSGTALITIQFSKHKLNAHYDKLLVIIYTEIYLQMSLGVWTVSEETDYYHWN